MPLWGKIILRHMYNISQMLVHRRCSSRESFNIGRTVGVKILFLPNHANVAAYTITSVNTVAALP